MDGASSASPVRTSLTAATRCSGVTSLSRNPLAPAASPAYTYSSRSNVVRMMIRVLAPAGTADRIRFVASIPSIPGMRMSMSTTSGRSFAVAATASAPSAASAATSIPADARISRNPPRTSAWSSAITTFTPRSPP